GLVLLSNYYVVATSLGDAVGGPPLAAPGPPFRSADGHWFEIETLDPASPSPKTYAAPGRDVSGRPAPASLWRQAEVEGGAAHDRTEALTVPTWSPASPTMGRPLFGHPLYQLGDRQSSESVYTPGTGR
ncbi:MAG: hypothetical protein ACRD0M_10825, partial [Acidimicrobiales bacterium]